MNHNSHCKRDRGGEEGKREGERERENRRGGERGEGGGGGKRGGVGGGNRCDHCHDHVIYDELKKSTLFYVLKI